MNSTRMRRGAAEAAHLTLVADQPSTVICVDRENSASYELGLAKSIAASLAEDSDSGDEANMLWSVVDHITRAKALIDDDTETLLRVSHVSAP